MHKEIDTKSILELPPIAWEEFKDKAAQPPGGWYKYSQEIEAVGVRLLLFSKYLEERSACYSYDGSHNAAAKAVKKLHTALRRALGYACPSRGVIDLTKPRGWISWETRKDTEKR